MKLPDDNPDAWEPYAENINKLMDLRYQGAFKTHTFNDKQRINFLQMVEEDVNNPANSVPVKRIEPTIDYYNKEDDEAQVKKRKVNENNNNSAKYSLRTILLTVVWRKK